MLDRVPRYSPPEGIEKFALALEAACLMRPGSALEAFDSSTLTFRQDYLEKSLTTASHDEFACLLRMLAASNADEHDIQLGFIGNEAVSGDNRQ